MPLKKFQLIIEILLSCEDSNINHQCILYMYLHDVTIPFSHVLLTDLQFYYP